MKLRAPGTQNNTKSNMPKTKGDSINNLKDRQNTCFINRKETDEQRREAEKKQEEL